MKCIYGMPYMKTASSSRQCSNMHHSLRLRIRSNLRISLDWASFPLLLLGGQP